MPDPDPVPTRQLVVCSLGEEEYALPVEQVREIVPFAEPRPVGRAEPSVRGVIGLRGRLLPVHDLGALLGLEAAATTGPRAGGKIVVVETGDEQLTGLVVDDVVEVLTIGDAQVEEVAAGERRAALAKLGERLVLLLDATRLLDDGTLRSVA
jgi:purine-binding chemotaxis protein CheW